MAERQRSKDGHRDSDAILGDKDQVADQGRAGGDLARKIATRDEEKRAKERPGGATRVTKADEQDSGADRGDE
ncbi:hypothetical protein [Roseovarius sp. MMSF_3281]|uniref:hypothetical protein n=1 Tax=Roseovarius sp. MMSF_3281 TaxID=3046694 RepID=UPI00273E4039|nr:hypothetical protein [Roseovarius sp. MMSF_3281]